MSTLEDLRAVLEHEAGFDDIDAPARPAAVRQRIRKARRRRAAAVATAAVAAVVATTALVGSLHSPQAPEPAGPTLGDVHVPERIDVLGFPYELSATQRAADDGSLGLGGAGKDENRVVTLVATGLGDGAATLWNGSFAVARVHGDDQLSAPVPVGGLSAMRVQLDDTPAAARAEVAIYEATGDPAPGVAADGVVFRQRYEDHELVEAAFGHAGGDARVDVPDSVGGLTVSAYCHSEVGGLWLHQEGVTGGYPCADFDTGNDPGWMNRDSLLPPKAGEDTAAVYVTHGADGPRASDVDVTFGLGLYRQSGDPTRVLGAELQPAMGYQGRTWWLNEVIDPQGADEYQVDTASGDVLLILVTDGTTFGDLSWRGAYDHSFTSFGGSDATPSATTAGILFAGDRYAVQMRLKGPDPESRLVLYRSE